MNPKKFKTLQVLKLFYFSTNLSIDRPHNYYTYVKVLLSPVKKSGPRGVIKFNKKTDFKTSIRFFSPESITF